MRSVLTGLVTSTGIALLAAAPATATTMRSNVAFNTGIGQKTANQPANGVEVAYQVKLQGGELTAARSTSSRPCIRATKVPGASSTSPGT